MSEIHWGGQGPEFQLTWSGMNWTLRLDGPNPGIQLLGAGRAMLFSLAGLAVRGRSCAWQSALPRLVSCDRLFDRIEGTYTFSGWGDLSVRASWGLVREISAVDFEIQISATSVDELKKVEIEVVSATDWPDEPEVSASASLLTVEPRDRQSAGLSYDGREAPETLRGLTTLPIPLAGTRGLSPRVIPAPWSEETLHYVEIAHPDDVARRVDVRRSGPLVPIGTSVRYGLFGHDLEKGVVLRSRMRGLWLQGAISDHDLERLERSFREEPLPLGP